MQEQLLTFQDLEVEDSMQDNTFTSTRYSSRSYRPKMVYNFVLDSYCGVFVNN